MIYHQMDLLYLMPVINSYPKSSWLVFCYQIFAWRWAGTLRMCENNSAFRLMNWRSVGHLGASAHLLYCESLIRKHWVMKDGSSQSITEKEILFLYRSNWFGGSVGNDASRYCSQ